MPEACWQGEGEPGRWLWRAFSDLGWPPLCCGCHQNLNGDVIHSGQKGLCLSVINYSVVLYPWSQSKMGKWTRLQGPRIPVLSWLGSHGHCLQLDMLESWLWPVVSLSVRVRKGHCWGHCEFYVIMYALCQVEHRHSVGNWDSPRLCLSWDCKCGAAGAIEWTTHSYSIWKLKMWLTCLIFLSFRCMLVLESLFIVDRARRIVFHMKTTEKMFSAICKYSVISSWCIIL